MYNSQWTCGNLMEMIHLFYVYRYVYQYLLSSTPVYLKNKFDVKSSHNTKFYFSFVERRCFQLDLIRKLHYSRNVIIKETLLQIHAYPNRKQYIAIRSNYSSIKSSYRYINFCFVDC